MHGDSTDAGETARTASITDSHGAVWPDTNARTGFLLKEEGFMQPAVSAPGQQE